MTPDDEDPDLERYWRRLGHRQEPEPLPGIALVPLVVPMPDVHPVIHVQLLTVAKELVGERFPTTVTPVGPPWRVRLNHVFRLDHVFGMLPTTFIWGFAVFEWETATPFHVPLEMTTPLAAGVPIHIGAVFDLPTLKMVHETSIIKRPPWQAPV